VNNSERLHILGIRHHGPGSAASVLDALNALDPAEILVECPADAESVLPFAAAEGMRPPVAILIHAVDDPARSVFLPFAEYSPEWQALRWGLARKRTLRLIDLPVALMLPIPPDGVADPSEADEQKTALKRDPLGMLAAAAGESDGETWWNALVEQGASGRDVFPVIADAMANVRDAFEVDAGAPSGREALREAHMRLAIREALARSEGSVAVICGAWHVPALRRDIPAKADREMLKGLERCKTEATWVPWTDSRLAVASGYGAGVVSPGWYEHLWRAKASAGFEDFAARWQARVARLLRDEGILAPTASAIEAARLSISLAAVRGFAVPGLGEMQDASLAALCHGEITLLKLIETKLVIGTRIGEIDADVPRMPLLADLERWQKRLRLKPSATEEEITLDLRSETGLLKSTLLHRLSLIAVPWGRKIAASASRGTFRENWQLAWQPELNVKLAEALRWGATIEQAAMGAAEETAANAVGVAPLAELIELCLFADLPGSAERATARLQSLAVNSSDIGGLMQAVAPLANVLRYGTARKVPQEALLALVTSHASEVCAGLAYAARGLDEEATAAMYRAMRAFDGAVSILEGPHFLEAWQEALRKLANSHDTAAAPFLRGYAARRLYDRSTISAEEMERQLSFALSPSVAPGDACAWLEGFLSESAQLLLHDAQLHALVDRWMMDLGEESFINLLPGLRRAFVQLETMERRRLIAQSVSGSSTKAAASGDARAERAFAAALPLLNLILGLDGDEP